MSGMDPFEVRMQFLALLRRLNAKQQSIQKVVGYALKYHSLCAEDLWDCVMEECQKGSMNSRINVFYFLDSLCESCLQAKTHPRSVPGGSQGNLLYVDYVERDLVKIVEFVVPEGRQGLPNLVSTKQILDNWRSKRVVDPQKVDELLFTLNTRTAGDTYVSQVTPIAAPTSQASLSKNEVFERIEEDRERHKRLRERRWVQPISQHPQSSLIPPPLATFLPLDLGKGMSGGDGAPGTGWSRGEELTLDIEFENEWETTSDWNEDDDEAVTEESVLCFHTDNQMMHM